MPSPKVPEPPKQRTPDEIEQELADTTQRLASRVDELVYRIHPRRLVRSGVAEVRAKFVREDGSPKPETLGAALGALVGIAVLVWRSRRNR
jgi:Protein of unknown function (DUF3618)